MRNAEQESAKCEVRNAKLIRNSEQGSYSMDEIFMREALCEAQRAGELDEVPVGAIVVRDGKIIARA